MTQNSSATAQEETPHAIQSTENNILNVKSIASIAVKRRAQSLIKDKSIDAGARGLIRYALEINDPCLTELVRRADAGDVDIDTLNFSEMTESSDDGSSEEKIQALAEMICRRRRSWSVRYRSANSEKRWSIVTGDLYPMMTTSCDCKVTLPRRIA